MARRWPHHLPPARVRDTCKLRNEILICCVSVMDLCLLRCVCWPHPGPVASNTPRIPELASQEGGGSRGRRRRRRDGRQEREREEERYIPPADATRSIERTNKLSCFKGRTKRRGTARARLLGSVPSAWRLLIFNTQFFIRVFVVSAGKPRGRDAIRVLGR